ncbi:MAG: DUF4340 domain-containing protein [Clostridia bacterium]|nr:DUF4340 domain-containing protein [Clostridia bacterium]
MWVKDKLVRNIIISVAVIALLVGAYIWVVNIPENTADTPTDEKPSGVLLYQMNVADIETVYVKNPQDEYTMVKSNDGYTFAGYENVEFSMETMANAIVMFANPQAEREIENPDISQYGVETPSAVMEISGGGTKNTLHIGNKMVGGEGYFVLHKETGRVYLMPSGRISIFMKEVNDYRPNVVASADITSINKLNITRNGTPVVNIRRLNEDEKNKFSMFTSYVMTYPEYASVQSGALDELAENMGMIAVNRYVEDNPKNLAKYGLGSPRYVLELETGGGSYTVLYGNRTETGGVYAMIKGKNFVFEQSSEIYSSLETVQVLRLIERYAHIIDMYVVSEITVSGGGSTHTFTLSGNDQNKKVTVDGKNANLEKFKTAYQSMIGVEVSGFAKNVNGGTEVAKLVFKYYDGTTVTARYLTYDERNYALERNGVVQSTVLKENINAMLGAVNEFASNPD